MTHVRKGEERREEKFPLRREKSKGRRETKRENRTALRKICRKSSSRKWNKRILGSHLISGGGAAGAAAGGGGGGGCPPAEIKRD